MPSPLLILTASHNRNLQLAERVLAASRTAGLSASVLDLTALALSFYTSRGEAQGPGADFERLHQAMAEAGGLWICAPEYNGGIPPSLTNAIAWLSRAAEDFRSLFNGKPVALATHSGGGGQKVLSALRIQFSHLGCIVLGRELLSHSRKPANPDTITAMVTQMQHLMGAGLGH
ncbi:NADPH-dependent FMN reductase [Candidatus Synechococcus spongiarum]|uniref:NADPH-dependent oxidoreductase n=1 Tax=Candidatus Synechococcus spongiarum LMB bulk15N TaxID=1943583 RepID=A0A1T1D5S0_9SYNE|nr:NAD(P)H-dependent oxidoreductase [Candidatus Synechococcus spongiarum]OOV36192.1 NADPH-dependent oxidoreductase [Candidatus Synechococcus spongiarum LMB bulk15N]